MRGAREVGGAVKKGAKAVGRLGAAIGRVGKVAMNEAKTAGKNVGAAVKHEVNPYAAAAKESQDRYESKRRRAVYKAGEQRGIDQADAEKAYTKKGWHESKEGKEAFARHKNLMKNGDAAQRSAIATSTLKTVHSKLMKKSMMSIPDKALKGLKKK